MSDSEQRRRPGRLPCLRCFKEEEAAIREKAADCGMSVGQFLLAAALGRRTRSQLDAHVINELRRLGGLQKHLFNAEGGAHSREYALLLVEIRDAIARIGS